MGRRLPKNLALRIRRSYRQANMSKNNRRLALLSAVRQSPEAAAQLLDRLNPAARAELLRQVSIAPSPKSLAPRPHQAAAATQHPGLAKCRRSEAQAGPTPLGLQLAAFSRTIGRVG